MPVLHTVMQHNVKNRKQGARMEHRTIVPENQATDTNNFGKICVHRIVTDYMMCL